MTEPAGDGLAVPRAFLRVGGATLARHQLALALALDCQRVICVARDLHPDLIALQHDAEARGAQFHVIRDPRALAALVTAHDDLLVLGEGLFILPDAGARMLDDGAVVVVQPVEAGLAAGFERIDFNRATAGAMRLPGRLAGNLAELPSDCDVFSALTRIALQAGVVSREVPVELRNTRQWRLVRDEGDAHALEEELVRWRLGSDFVPTPGRYLARWGVLAFGPALLHSTSASQVARIASLAGLVLAFGAAWLGAYVTALLLCALAALLHHGATMLKRVERAMLGPDRPTYWREEALGWSIDIVLVLLLAWHGAAGGPVAAGWHDHLFAPVMLVLVTRLLPRILGRTWPAWIEDRVVLSLVLVVAAAGGLLGPAIEIASALLALAGLVLHGGRARITSA